jgi:predicted outer membrane repeat protein
MFAVISVAASPTGTITVTNTDDSGPGSLRQAIADAGPGDTIDFALTYPATITLASAGLTIAKPMTIAGPGPGLLAVSGGHPTFRVDDLGGASQIAVTISGLTIRDGSSMWGGGLWTDELLTLSDVSFVDNGPSRYGGALYVRDSSPTLTNVSFRGNSAYWYGGAIFNYFGSPILTGVSFHDNSAEFYDGGAIYNNCGSLTLADVTFSGNSAVQGGGLYNEGGSATLEEVIFRGNSAREEGGGMFNQESSPTLTNVSFSGNSAGTDGGGLYNFCTSPTLANVTFNGNWAGEEGGGMGNYGSSYGFWVGGPTVQNSILWGNRAESAGDQIYNENSTAIIAHSDVQGSGGSGPGWDADLGSDGGGNLEVDPLFVELIDPEHAPTTGGDLHLQPGSPAIDTGDNELVPPGVSTDLDGNARIVNGTVDMGAYEVQVRETTIFVPLCLRGYEHE